MKITRISAFQVDLPLHEGRYAWSGGNWVDDFDSTVTKVETEVGPTGYCEACPLGPVYLPSNAGEGHAAAWRRDDTSRGTAGAGH